MKNYWQESHEEIVKICGIHLNKHKQQRVVIGTLAELEHFTQYICGSPA